MKWKSHVRYLERTNRTRSGLYWAPGFWKSLSGRSPLLCDAAAPSILLRALLGSKRLFKHKLPSSHAFWTPPSLEPFDQDVESFLFMRSFGPFSTSAAMQETGSAALETVSGWKPGRRTALKPGILCSMRGP